MKILHLSNVYDNKSGGGIHEVVSNLFVNQKNVHMEPHIWFFGGHTTQIESIENIKPLKFLGNKKFGLIKKLFCKKTKELYQFDLIHQHGIWLTNSLLTIQLKNKYSIPTIIQPHGFLEPYSFSISKIKKRIVWNLFEKRNLKNADVLVACSKKEAINLKKIFPHSTIAIIPNGVSTEFFLAKNSVQFKDSKIMLFLSRIHPSKGLERFLLEVYKLGKNYFKDWHIIIAGNDELNHTEYLVKLATDLEIDELISFPGPKYKQEKIDLISNADIFILPTFTENFGIVVAESLARGVPVMTTTGAPWSDLIKNKCGFWVDNSPEGIREGLMSVMGTSESELRKMGERGKRLIKNKYLWPSVNETTNKLYQWLLFKGEKPDIFL